ncbi:MAG TPA: hypothetical protein VM095_19455 [Pyrinomonadaceae bacterium]|nr:hypothetical protein [Pyrinomonadaceae bacterium]
MPENEQKQDADKGAENPEREGLTADELGKQSSYDDVTVMQSHMLRGDETKGDPDARDVAGTTALPDTHEARTDKDTRPGGTAGEDSAAK